MNAKITKSALALWTAKDPAEELRKLGFERATYVNNIEVEDICLIVDLEESSLSFGLVAKVEENHLTFTFYEEVGGDNASMNVKIPKKTILIYKLDCKPPKPMEN